MVLLCTLLAGAGQLLLKAGAIRVADMGWRQVLTNRPLIAGYALYAIATVLFLWALRRGKLSVVYPLLGATYIWVTIASPLVFPSDSLNPTKVCGVILIAVGVTLVGLENRS